MRAPFWDDESGYEELIPLNQLNAWNIVLVGGRQLPGYCEVKGDGIELDADIQKPKGSAGATVRFHGTKPSKITIEMTMYHPRHWDLFQDILPELIPKHGKKDPEPKVVDHPALSAYGITALVFIKIPLPDKKDVGRAVTFECLYWTGNPKKVGTSKPKSAANKPPPTVLNDRERAWRDEYQNRTGISTPADKIPPPPPSFLDAAPDVP